MSCSSVELLDVVVELVDHLVPVGQGLGRLPVPGQQGVGGAGHGLADQGEQLQDLPVDLFEGVVHSDHRTPVGPGGVHRWPSSHRRTPPTCAGYGESADSDRVAGLRRLARSGSLPPSCSLSPTMTRGPEPHDR